MRLPSPRWSRSGVQAAHPAAISDAAKPRSTAVAVIIAALAGFGLGAVWYMVLSKPWMHAVGKTEADRPKGSAQILLFATTLVALFVMALMLARQLRRLSGIRRRQPALT